MATDTAERVLWRDCKHCGTPFVQPRRRGRPKVTCSDDCKERRGVHGDVRLTRRASRGTGVVVVIRSARHSSHDPTGAVLADLFGGDYETGTPDGFITEGYRDRELKRAVERERLAADGLSVTDDYGLPAALDEGRTCPEIKRVIGVTDPWDWQERLSA